MQCGFRSASRAFSCSSICFSGVTHRSRTAMPAQAAAGSMPERMPGFLARVLENNTGLEVLPSLIPFSIEGSRVGAMKPAFVEHIEKFGSDVFVVANGAVTLNPGLDSGSPEERTRAVAGVLSKLRDAGVVTGWRDELYPVSAGFYDEPKMLLERAAATHFGIKAYGIHVNGYVHTQDRGVCLWVASVRGCIRRSKSKPNWPGKLDHIVAGGQPYGISVMENVIKECEEEASMPKELASTAISAGAVSYMNISPIGLKPDVLFVFDINLPEDFHPKPLDGEVESFALMSVDEVAAIVAESTEFKSNCNIVIIDFLIRLGHECRI